MKRLHILVIALSASLAGCIGPNAEVPPRPTDLPPTYQPLVPPRSSHTPPRSPAERAKLEAELRSQAVTPR